MGAQTALLVALASGPGFGLELIARVLERTRGLLRLNRGGAYLALRRLERVGLVHGWMRRLPRSGRPRRYYELTPEGILRAEELRRALAALTGASGPGVTDDEARRMADRVREGADLSVAAIELRDAGRRAGLQ
jgi:PadR family transcriptional regulator PadR